MSVTSGRDGPRAAVGGVEDRYRRATASQSQAARRRYEMWRRDRDENGLTVDQIATIYRVHPVSVYRGIRVARQLRRELENADLG